MTKTLILAAAATVAIFVAGTTMMDGLSYLPFAIIAAVATSVLAKRRGRGAYNWFRLTLLISPLFSLPLLFALKNRQPMLELLEIAEKVYR